MKRRRSLYVSFGANGVVGINAGRLAVVEEPPRLEDCEKLTLLESSRSALSGRNWGQPVAADALARLLADERAASDRDGPQGVWVGLGICPDGRGDPERWVRSDWPLWVRVVDGGGLAAPPST